MQPRGKLKLTRHKCHFGETEIDFLGRTIKLQGIESQKQKVQTCLEKKTKYRNKKNIVAVSLVSKLLSHICLKTIRKPSTFLPDAQK